MSNRLSVASFRAAAIVLVAGLPALADAVVTYTTTPLLGGFYQYDMTVMNLGGTEPFSGLVALYGSSIFNLDDTSTIGTPSNWSFLAPLPTFVDPLSYFSLAPGADIPIGGKLSGFSFQSSTDPSTLTPGNFAVDAIGSISNAQIPLGDAQHVPEADVTFAEIILGVGVSLIIGRVQIIRRRDR